MNFTDLRVIRTQERFQNAMLELLRTKQFKEITIKDICTTAGVSRNAFYQHYGYKEDLYNQMVAVATETIREALLPVIPDASGLQPSVVESYAKQIIDGIVKVKDLLYVMLKSDEGIFLRQLTDLIFGQTLTNAISFFGVEDSPELRLYYEYYSAGIAAIVIRMVLEEDLSEERAVSALSRILLLPPADLRTP